MNNIFFIDESHKIYPEWEAKKLGEIVTIRTGKLDANAQVENGAFRFYTCAKTYSMIDNYAFDTEALLISGNGAHVGYIHYYKGKFNAYQRTYVVEVPKADTKFIQYYLERHLKQRIEGEKNEGSMPYIVLGTLTEMPVSLPYLAEQQKIAEFFSALDERIALTADKVKLLKEQKQGYLQKIFAQEMVFTDDNGQRYPEWEKKKLGTLGTWGKSYSYSRAFQGEGALCHIHYGDIHSIYSGVARTSSLPSITVESTNHELANDGDVIFADASEDVKDLGKSVVLKNDATRPFISGLHTHRFISDSDSLNPYFLMYFTQTAEYHDFMRKYGTGVSVLGISKTNLNLLPLLLPSLLEQEKIAEFFSALDEQLELTENKLTLLKEQKKGYLQGIFD